MDKPSRILIIGIYGTGKSTLAHFLARSRHIPHHELDDLKYIRKYDRIRSVEQRIKKLNAITKRKKWIIEGTWTNYAQKAYERADIVVFLDIPAWRLYPRIIKRFIKRKRTQKELRDNSLRTTAGLVKKVRRYRKNNPREFLTRQTHIDMITKHAKKRYIIKTKKELEKFVKEVTDKTYDPR